MANKERSVFVAAAERIPIKLLDGIIIIGIAAMALIIPFLSAKGGFTVNFDSSGGTAVDPQRLRYGEDVLEPDPPTREDYTFVGWFCDPLGREAFDFEKYDVNENITLFAVWEKIEDE